MKHALAPLVLLSLLGCACRDLSPDPFAEVWAPRGPESEVVARVEGSPIVAQEVRRRRALRDGGAVLEDLILEDILAAEAKRQGLDSDPQVRRAAKRALVRKLIVESFEKRTQPEHIPERFLRRAYQKNYWFFNRPEVRRFEHVVVMTKPNISPEKEKKAKEIAARMLAALKSATPPSFKELHARFEPMAKAAGLELKYEKAHGVKSRLEKAFARLLWQTPTRTTAGETVRSRFGWHVLRHLERKKAVRHSFEEVKEEIRRRAFGDFRRMRFRQWLKELRANHHAAMSKNAKMVFLPVRKTPR